MRFRFSEGGRKGRGCKGINARGWCSASRRPRTDGYASQFGAKDRPTCMEEAGIRSPIAKFFHSDLLEEITHELEGKPVIYCFCCRRPRNGLSCPGGFAPEAGGAAGLAGDAKRNFLWVVDFPRWSIRRRKRYRLLIIPLQPRGMKIWKNWTAGRRMRQSLRPGTKRRRDRRRQHPYPLARIAGKVFPPT